MPLTVQLREETGVSEEVEREKEETSARLRKKFLMRETAEFLIQYGHDVS